MKRMLLVWMVPTGITTFVISWEGRWRAALPTYYMEECMYHLHWYSKLGIKQPRWLWLALSLHLSVWKVVNFLPELQVWGWIFLLATDQLRFHCNYILLSVILTQSLNFFTYYRINTNTYQLFITFF